MSRLFPDPPEVAPEVESVRRVESILSRVGPYVRTVEMALVVIEEERFRYPSSWTWSSDLVDEEGGFGVYRDMVTWRGRRGEEVGEWQEARIPMFLTGTDCRNGGSMDALVISRMARALVRWAERTGTPYIGPKFDMNPDCGKWHPWRFEEAVWKHNAILIGRWWAREGALRVAPFDERFVLDMAGIIVEWWRRCIMGVSRVDPSSDAKFKISKPGIQWSLTWTLHTWEVNGGGSQWEWHSEPRYTFGRDTLFEKLSDAERSAQSQPTLGKWDEPVEMRWDWQEPNPYPFKTWEARIADCDGLENIDPKFVPDRILNPPPPEPEEPPVKSVTIVMTLPETLDVPQLVKAMSEAVGKFGVGIEVREA